MDFNRMTNSLQRFSLILLRVCEYVTLLKRIHHIVVFYLCHDVYRYQNWIYNRMDTTHVYTNQQDHVTELYGTRTTHESL